MGNINRESLYRKFGPLLFETLVLIIKDELNLLRTEAGLTPRTNQQLMNAIDSKLKTLDLYNWMDEDI